MSVQFLFKLQSEMDELKYLVYFPLPIPVQARFKGQL